MRRRRRNKRPTDDRPTTFSRQHPRVDVIFNKVSGQRDPSRDLSIIRATLSRSFSRVVLWNTTPERGGEKLGLEAIADGAEVLVACGGDGTVAGVACAIKRAFSQDGLARTLAVIPRGTANAFCAALSIPTDVRRAAEMVASGSMRRIDFPIVRSASDEAPRAMLLLAGIGLEAEAIENADRRMKRVFGIFAYGFSGIRSTWRQESFTTEVLAMDVEDELMFAGGDLHCREMRLTNLKLKGVTIANVAPPTSVLAQGIGTVKPEDGLLEVVCVGSSSAFGLVRTMAFLLRSALLRTREQRGSVYGLRAKRVRIVCDPPQHIVIDGEMAGVTPIDVEIGDKDMALNVIAPKARAVTRRRRRISRALRRLWRNVRGAGLLTLSIFLLRRRGRKEVVY